MSEADEAKTVEEVGQGDNSEDAGSEEPSSQGDNPSSDIASQLMQNPQVLAALQSRLGDIVGTTSGYIQSLPKPVKRRIKALKKLQFEATKIEAEFYREVHKLECKYATKYAPLYDKRLTVVSGDYEPNDEEADWPSDDEKDEELSDKANSGEEKSNSQEEVKKASIEEKGEEDKEKSDKEEKESDAKGVPGFWLTIFKNVDMLSEMIQPHDEPILNTLRDVKVEFVDINDTKDEKDPMGFKLQFHFDTNDYFENKVLTKEYVMRSVPDETDPFSFEGPEIVKCTGCTIDWKKGKNVTVKTVKKKQKHKASGTTRTISKTVQSDSFFNFFNPPTPPDDEEMDEDTESLLAADFEIGHFIRERIVPRAVLYFTGEALENDDEYDDEGEEEEGGDDYDEDGDPDFDPQSGKFFTPRFQARCAELALAQVTKPSSAPCDTRIALRPQSGAQPRPKSVSVASQEQHASSKTSDRPVTAPFSRPATRDKTENETVIKPTVKTDAFTRSNSDVARPKSVSFKNTTMVGIEDQGKIPKLEKERTKILSSVIEPEKTEKPISQPIKLTREQTFYDKKPNEQIEVSERKDEDGEIPSTSQKETIIKEGKEKGQDNNNAGDPSKGIMKTSGQIQEHEQKHEQGQSSTQKSDYQVMKTSSQKHNNEQKQPTIQKSEDTDAKTLDNKSDNVCSREAEEKKDLRNVSAKTDTGLVKIRKQGRNDAIVKGQNISKPSSGTKADSRGQNVNKPGSGEITVSAQDKSGVESSGNDTTTMKGVSGKSRAPNKLGMSSKTLRQARSGHKQDNDDDEQSTDAGSSKSSKKPASTKDTAFTILKNLTGKRGQGSHKPGHVPSVQRPVRKYKFDKPSGPSSSQVIQAIIDDKSHRLKDGDDKEENSSKNKVDYKPSVTVKVPLPTSTSSSKERQLGVENKRSSSGIVRQKGIDNVIKPTSAPPHKAQKVEVEKRSAKLVPEKSEHLPKDMSNDKQQSDKSGNKIPIDNVEAGISVTSSMKGVRLQNGMIATETEPTGETTSLDDKSGNPDIPNLHPKYRESPYLKDNPLLMSGKPRQKASASSLGRSKDANL